MTAAEPASPAMPSLVILLLGGTVLITFGYLRAVMHRANSDYKKTKASLPGMRKDFWRAWWAAVKVGFWVAVGGLVLIAWVVHDVRGADDKPTPAPAKVSPK